MCNQTEFYKDMAEWESRQSMNITDKDQAPECATRANDKLIVFKDKSGEYRWKRVAPNGRSIAVSGESHVNWEHAFTMLQALWPGEPIIIDISGTQFGDKD